MKLPFEKIFEAFEATCFGEPGSVIAFINKESGEIYYYAEYGDNDEVPGDLLENDIYLALPEQGEFCHGCDLVFKFASAEVRDHADEIYDIFQSRGAFSRLKILLADIGKLDDWYRFQEEHHKEELRKWCEMNGVDFE